MNDGRREVLINARFLTQTITGVQRYAFEIVKQLDKLVGCGAIDREKHSLVLLTPRGAEKHTSNFGHLPSRTVGRLGGNAWSQLELPYHARSGVLWSPTNTGPLYHAHHVLTIHDISVLDHPEWFDSAYAAWYRFLLPRLAKRTAHILTVSEFSRRRLIETLNVEPERVSVVPNGVDARFEPAPSDTVEAMLGRLRLPRNYLLALGTLERRKNLLRLLEAWDLLLSRRAVAEEVHLVVTGGNSSVFRHAGLSGLPRRVQLTGYVADEDLPALYSGALALIYPSLYEGFGLPPLEAMACGTPVVTSGTSSIPEVTGDAALLVDPSDTESIAKGMKSVLDNGALRDTLRTAGLERSKLFNWDDSAQALWERLSGMAA